MTFRAPTTFQVHRKLQGVRKDPQNQSQITARPTVLPTLWAS